MFTRQHYKAIADIVRQIKFRDNKSGTDLIFAGELTTRLADYFQQDNPNFDRDRFFDAIYSVKVEA